MKMASKVESSTHRSWIVNNLIITIPTKPTLSPTTPIFASDKRFDLSKMDNSKLINDYTINLHSAVGNGTDAEF